MKEKIYEALLSTAFGAYFINVTKDQITGIIKDDEKGTMKAIFREAGVIDFPANYTQYVNALRHSVEEGRQDDYLLSGARESLLKNYDEGIYCCSSECWFTMEDGSIFYPISEFYLIKDDDSDDICALVVNRDKTAYHNKREEHKEILKRALYQAESANRAKKSFLTNISHDIRTPMNAIVGFTELAATHIDDTKLLKDYIDKIRIASDNMLNIINDVLDMSRIEGGKITLEESECNIAELAKGVYDVMQKKADEKQLYFYLYTSAINDRRVICDKVRLNQIMTNLISNAIKFTKSGGTVITRVSQIGKSGDKATYEIRVKDTGIGMSPEFIPHIFGEFDKERSATLSGAPGTGLGMTITKNIVDIMGGDIKVESKEGIGTEFIVTFSFVVLDNEGAGVYHSESSDKISFKREKVLIVEDNELNAEIAAEILRHANLSPEIAENGAVAVELLKKAEPGFYKAVLMDIQMPVMDGIEATRRIRAFVNPWSSNIPIIAMTANVYEEDREACMDAGMNAYIAKPINVPELMITLKKYIQ